jgi:hypothetical protein
LDGTSSSSRLVSRLSDVLVAVLEAYCLEEDAAKYGDRRRKVTSRRGSHEEEARWEDGNHEIQRQ